MNDLRYLEFVAIRIINRRIRHKVKASEHQIPIKPKALQAAFDLIGTDVLI